MQLEVYSDNTNLIQHLRAVAEVELLPIFITRSNNPDKLGSIIDSEVEQRERIMIFDVDFGKVPYYRYCRNLRKRNKKVGIIFMGSQNDIISRLDAFEVGADMFIKFPRTNQEFQILRAQINAMIRRLLLYPEENIELENGIEIDVRNKQVKYNSSRINLTPQEKKLIFSIVRRHPKLTTKQEILQALTNKKNQKTTSLLNVHMFNIRKKLDNLGLGDIFKHNRPMSGYSLKAKS